MNLHTETVTEVMLVVAEKMNTLLGSEWYLAGGTALALQIGHRASVDLDYFCAQSFDVDMLRVAIQDTFAGEDVTFDFEAKETLWCTIRGVKVSCITRKESLLHECISEGPFTLASIKDIVVMKLLAICSREEYKDYFDLACLSRETDTRLWPQWWMATYSHQDLTSWLVALSAVTEIKEIPLVIQPSYAVSSVTPTLKSVVVELTAYLEKTKV